MRQALASLLLVVWSFPLAAGLLQASAGPQLPACCRRDGKHHCTLQTSGGHSTGPVFQAIAEKCPAFPAATVARSGGNAALLKGSGAVWAALAAATWIPRQIAPSYRLTGNRSCPKRGPPVLS